MVHATPVVWLKSLFVKVMVRRAALSPSKLEEVEKKKTKRKLFIPLPKKEFYDEMTNLVLKAFGYAVN